MPARLSANRREADGGRICRGLAITHTVNCMAKTYGNRWEIVRTAGQGGQADVFVVRDRKGEYPGEWILKRLRNGNRVERFEREIRALQNFACKRIPPIVDYSLHGTAFLVCERLGGRNLCQWCETSWFSVEQALALFQQVVEAVRHAHQIGIPHRDIKPNNICVSENGSDAYLVDFGICQLVEDGLILTTTAEPLGNALFSAPECMPEWSC